MSPLTAEIFHLFTKGKKNELKRNVFSGGCLLIQYTLEGTFLCELDNDHMYLNSSFFQLLFCFYSPLILLQEHLIDRHSAFTL